LKSFSPATAQPEPENARGKSLFHIYAAAKHHRRWAMVLAGPASELSALGGALHAGAQDEKSFSFGATQQPLPPMRNIITKSTLLAPGCTLLMQ
jgi:hypothetical protein